MISAKFGHLLDKPLSPLVRRFNLSPNSLTLTGFLITVAAAVAIPRHLIVGGLLIILGGLFDILDGIVARIKGKETEFGAFLDSVLDRFSDAAIFLAIGWRMYLLDNITGAALSMITLTGALLISYTRARAEGIGKKCSTGLMERTERIVLITFGCLADLLTPILWLLAILTFYTVVQRIFHVWKETRQPTMLEK